MGKLSDCQQDIEGGLLVKRCPWCGIHEDYRAYHDYVWGRPINNSVELFAKLCLDGQQAGLSWLTILRKQVEYEQAFYGLNPYLLSELKGQERMEFINHQLQNPGIIRNRRKISAIFKNADGFLQIEQAGQSFSEFIWSFVGGKPIINAWRYFSEVPTETEESRSMSRALKKAGFSFVGPTICYAYMQAVGLVNDHLVDCSFRRL